MVFGSVSRERCDAAALLGMDGGRREGEGGVVMEL
mgnify:CR=1 FL=1